MSTLQPIVGLVFIGLIAYASRPIAAPSTGDVAWGFGLQIVFALIVLKTTSARRTFEVLGDQITQLLGFAVVGSSFVFGPLGNQRRCGAGLMTGVLGPEGAQYSGDLRVPGPADDHLHRGAVRDPLLLRHHAGRRPRSSPW